MKGTVIFDLDGTLLNTLDDLAAAVGHALGAFGYAPLAVSDVRRYVGNGVPKLVSRALRHAACGGAADVDADELPDPRESRCLELFTEYYNAHSADMTAPYPGIAQMLTDIKAAGYKSAIVTNKYDGAAKALGARFFPQIDVIVGAADGIRPKPAPDGTERAIALLGADRARTVYVGDGETDMATARACGLPVIAVTWGYRDRAVIEPLSPDMFIDSPGELMPALAALGL